jgi:putative AbiEii toxin of type IV toxin-antitoxin system/AAA ATPase-like protein
MISQFEIKNFRCYRQWHQSGLKRFNFIVGESGTGKTALLEALFMVGASNPEIWFRLRRWRGIGEGQVQIGTRDSYEGLFRDLFYQYDVKSKASVLIWDTDFGKRELEVFFEDQDVYSLPLRDDKEERENAFALNPVVFKWDLRNHVYRTTVEIVNGALRLQGKAEVYPIILISTRGHSPREYAGYYSALSRKRKSGPVLDALKDIFPEVSAISLEMVAGEPLLHVDVQGIDELIALGDLSGGLDRYVSIVVSILMNRGGAILIDEIETGFYYKNLPSLLNSIVKLCDKYNVQIFASTHSYEFLKIMTDAMPSAHRGSDDFCVLRLEKEMGHQPMVTLIEGSSYKSAIEREFEIR